MSVRPWPVGLAVVLLVLTHVSSAGDRHASYPAVTAVELDIDAAAGSAQPHLAGGDGLPVVLSWLEPADPGTALRFTTLGPDGWHEPQTLRQGSDWFVNWADFPSVVPVSDRVWAAHWLVKHPGGPYAYDIVMAISGDGGRTWSPDTPLHDDGTATEHGFVSLFPWQDGTGAVWLDGRDTERGDGAMTLRSAMIDRFAVVREPTLVDAMVCDCCPTDVAIAASGPVAAYRNRTDEEVRDIHVIRAVDGVWQESGAVAADGWRIAGCPVNGPAIAARGDRVAVAWFTAADDRRRVRLAFSNDSGRSFGEAFDVAVGDVTGRVDVVLDDAGNAIVSWLASPPGNGSATSELELRARGVSPQGTGGGTYAIARTGAGRPAGFPQMLLVDGQLVFAWTDTREERSGVRTARVDAASVSGRP